ncbi:hypothetical protein C1E24_13385 [Pseudoalteromonas phenolica]|uniref:Uncharacterized protein n=1 Tax=Pseudoalteromonas phenolica TaxID=161398 RepID=A0A5R9PZN1_9GAMM|nr:hypothetical protein [Pseudoalteromonas phenolica]TLX46358.1 hypothetical protein C1E24_13385 [Pseudoalteromonas phenolica]
MHSKGFYICGSLVTLLSILIIFFEQIPYIKYKDKYIAVSHVEIEHGKTLELEKAAFDLAIKNQDLEMLKAIYYQRLSAEQSSKELSVKGLDVAKALAQLIIIITVTFMLIGFAKQREYNKQLKRDK